MTINLQKGQRISLTKEGGSTPAGICIGVNWGRIQKKGWFGGTQQVAVDLDASVGIFDNSGTLREVVYYGKQASTCGSIKHSGDDLTGDAEDDGLDNEIISIDLTSLPAEADQLAFVLNSFRGQDFKDIPYARIRIYEGSPGKTGEVLATFDVANDSTFAGRVAMIIGKLYKHNNGWKFHSIGQPTDDKKLEQTLNTFASQYF